MRFNEDGKNDSQILIKVDDFIISATPDKKKVLRECFEQRFRFGKREDSSAEYAGRQVDVLEDRILVHQEKYILEQIHPIPSGKGSESGQRRSSNCRRVRGLPVHHLPHQLALRRLVQR